MNAHADFSNQFEPRQRRLLRLADYIENNGRVFDMERWNQCIAGHCADMIGVDHTEGTAAFFFLSLNHDEARQLFTPRREMVPSDVRFYGLGKIDREWAVATIRYFAFTGRIDWHATRPVEVKIPAEGTIGLPLTAVVVDELA